MLDSGRRPMGRLFYWAVAIVAASGLWISAAGAPQGGVGTTTIADTVYMADGTAASGSVIITWPAFVSASGAAVAAGETSVALGANGALSVALVPNAGATPAGVYYTVVYQLGPGQVKTEYWMVPTTSPANLATVRTTPGSGLAGQPVSMQYVNSGLATKADDSAVVHLNGAETISGTKTFASSPNVPAPTNSTDLATKGYVDQSVTGVGSGNYLSTAGGTLTGPLTLPGNPVAPLQAAAKQYVDFGLSGKADLISGLIPANELGTGTATVGSCLLGNGSWGACGGGGGNGNATSIQGINVSTSGPGTGSSLVYSGGQYSPLSNAAYDARVYGIVSDGATDNTAAVKALLTTIGSSGATIRLSPGVTAVDNITIPANVLVDYSAGGAWKTLTSMTAPGGAAFVNGTGAECGATASCSSSVALNGSTTLSTTAGNTLAVFAAPYPGFSYVFSSVTDSCGDQFAHVQQSLIGQPRNVGAWVSANIAGGSCTITATANGTLTNSQVIVQQFSGLGPIVAVDGAGASSNSVSNPMNSGAAATTAGSLLLGYGGQAFTAETCTAGSGYVQPAGTAGQTVSGYLCAEYLLSSPGGSQTATQNLSSLPANEVYNLLALRPGSATLAHLGGIFNPDNHQIFYNATGTKGIIDFTGNATLSEVRPEWWGASPAASAAVNTPALQAAIHGAFGTGRTNGSGLSVWNKPLILSGNYNINGELQFYDVLNFKVKCDHRLSGGITQNAANSRIIDGQSIAYGSFDDCIWTGAASSTNGLIDLDYNGVTTAGDLAPQFIDFNRNTFNGGGIVDTGVLISKSGGGAQGSNIYCWNCEGESFTGAVWQIGGDNTGRNAGRQDAMNAIDVGWYGGDMQGNPLYGLASYGGGHVFLRDTTEENGFQAQTGFDMWCSLQIGTEPCIMDNVRSESRRLISAGICQVRNSYTINQSAYPAPGSTYPVGSIMMGSAVAGDGQYYKVTVDAAPGFGGVGTPSSPVVATGGAATTIVSSGASWTSSAFVGMYVAVLHGTNVGCYGSIAANTATTITVSSWLTKYAEIACSAPDSTSTFVVEPGWNAGTVASGGMTLVALNERGIDGSNGNGGMQGTVENVIMPGDQVNLSGTAVARNLTVTRADWLPAVGGGWWSEELNHDWDAHILTTVSDGAGNYHYQNWKYPNAALGTLFSGPFQRNLGTTPLIWSCGNGGGLANACSDTWIGGRSDPFSTNSVSRTILEFGGVLGRATPTGVDQNGASTDIQGGLPTGAGTPGKINFRVAPTGGASGSTPVSGAIVASVDPNGLEGAIGGTTPAAGAFTNLSASSANFSGAVVANSSVTFAGVTGATQCLHVNATGVVSGTGADCGSGSGGGSGTVNSGATSQVAMYSANEAAVSGDAALTDSGTTLNYSGSGGISASSGTFGGNVTVGGQLILTGPWMADTPIPGSAMGAAATGTSSIGISNDGNFYISASGGTPQKIVTGGSAVTSVFGRTGAVTAQSGDYAVGQVTGAAPLASPTFTGTVTEPVPALPNQGANSFFAAPSGTAGAPGFRAIVAADIPTLNQNTTGNAGTATNVAGGAVGSIPYQTGAGGTAMLAGNTAASDQVLTSAGTGSAAQAPMLKSAPALSAANMSAFPNVVAGLSPAGGLATGDYVKANGYSTMTDSGVLAGPYPVPWITAVRGGVGAAFAQNTVKMWGVVLTYPLSTSNVAYSAYAADNTANLYDIGIACGQTSCNGGAYTAGQIVLNIGATAGTTFSPLTGARTLNWSQGTRTLQPGKYYVVITSNCASSCATITADSSTLAVTFQNGTTAGTTSGGALANFTAPSDVWSWGASVPALVVK